ncbi:cytochrome P450 CYP82D47-like [Gossypium hirsutum]|uniref:Cytochrome P450 CYP82D47-like n=1 Tax=Gossypium hirsutum TaxID=3635 RepID=A0ABM3BXQ4_GOSHI|nr:cytochrome P450 CYP82D47-like [Gossypium hirsutum]
MKKVTKDLDQVAEEWLREHKEKRAENEANSEEDFMGVLLSILSDIEPPVSYVHLLTESGKIKSYLSSRRYLINHNGDALNKVKQELDIHVGKDRVLQTESDTKNLINLKSETLRIYPTAPLSVIHEAIEDCSIQRDPQIWEDSLEFRLERFMTIHKDIDVKGHDFELIPFNSDRRMCHRVSIETLSGEAVDMRID